MAEKKQHNKYLPGYNEVKHHEMRKAENCAGYLIPTLKSMADANPDLTLLDVGAGSGTITASLAKYMPRGKVTAADLSEEILKTAEANAKQMGAENIEFQPANVYELPFPDKSFDVVHTHQMLCHLDTPLEALAQLLRVTKPDGVLAVRECDMRMWSWWPMLPWLDRFHQVQLATHEGAGGTNIAGPQLVSWAMKLGVPRDRITASQGAWCYSTPEERRIWGMLALFCLPHPSRRFRANEYDREIIRPALAIRRDEQESTRNGSGDAGGTGADG